jgi:glycosyltransferase involved in cell wall biosynthesis
VEQSPDISVVLATYNRRASLPRAIESVLAQDAAFELIVVDDASTDDTAAYLATLDDPRISVIAAARNLGPGGARNLGLEAARAEFVAFLDSDDAYLPGRLGLPLAAFAADPGLVCVLSSAVKWDRDVAREARAVPARFAADAFAWALIADLIPVESTSMTVRRTAAREVGGFCAELRLKEDREFLIRLAACGPGLMLDDLLWEKFWSDDSLSNAVAKAGPGLIAYLRQRPEYRGRYRKLGSYLATKTLVADLRAKNLALLLRDAMAFRREGLIGANLARLVRDHREVSRYLRHHRAAPGLAGTPPDWT